MDQTAIQEIQRLALAATNHDKLQIRNVALVPQGFTIEALEKYDQQPDRHRETFKTKYLSEFFGYAEKQDNDTPTVFVDENSMSATAIFDRSTASDPSWQQHKAIIKLEKTPALVALLQLDTKSLSQDQLIDFAIDWKDNITFWSDDEALTHNDALTRLRKLKISKTSEQESNRGDFKASASAIEQIAIDAQGLPLPSHFTFTTEPYLQFEKREYLGQIRALGDDNKPLLKYRLMGMPAIEQQIAEEFKQRISDGISQADIHIGTL